MRELKQLQKKREREMGRNYLWYLCSHWLSGGTLYLILRVLSAREQQSGQTPIRL